MDITLSRRSATSLLGLATLNAMGVGSVPAQTAATLPECVFHMDLEVLDAEGAGSQRITIEGEITRTHDQWTLCGWMGPGAWFSVPLGLSGEFAQLVAAVQSRSAA